MMPDTGCSDRPPLPGGRTGGAHSDDGFLSGRITVRQPRRGNRASIDAVLLAAAVPAGPGQSVLEAGAGSGVAALCLASRVADTRIVCVDADQALCELARENIALNAMDDRITAVAADITASAADLAAAGLAGNTFAHVFANPPYFEAGTVRASPNAAKRAAAVGERGDLDKWIRFLVRMAAPGGTVTLIYRAEGLARLLAALDGRFGALRVLALHPKAGRPANRIIVQGIKASRAPLSILPGLVLHDGDGGYTAQAAAILRDGAPLAPGF